MRAGKLPIAVFFVFMRCRRGHDACASFQNWAPAPRALRERGWSQLVDSIFPTVPVDHCSFRCNVSTLTLKLVRFLKWTVTPVCAPRVHK